jgi:AAA domain
MSRLQIRALRVSGVDRANAEIDFGPRLTLVTGKSDTGKTHIVECLDFALGAESIPKKIPERKGYDLVAIEVVADASSYVLARRFSDPDNVTIYEGGFDDWNGEDGEAVKATLKGARDATETLSNWLLERSDFDVSVPVVRNQRGEHQRLSFRTFAPMVLVDEAAVISPGSPILSSQSTQHTANRSIFGIVMTGKSPTLEEVEGIRRAHERRETAGQRLLVLDPMIEDLRAEISNGEVRRGELESELERLERELAEVSEVVSRSGQRAREFMGARNRALVEVQENERKAQASRDLQSRFALLNKHYVADVRRLEFVVEGGHFFQQIAASHCPTCGSPIGADSEECHPESADYRKIEKSARAEIQKLAPRMEDLKNAMADAEAEEALAVANAKAVREHAARLDREIEEVANPSAQSARKRVGEITARRRILEDQLLRFRELDRYLAARQEADIIAHQPIERFRPEQDAPSLVKLSSEIKKLLVKWKFPVDSDLTFDIKTDDLVIDGKARSAFGKGARAITHTGFTVGLMAHCLSAGTPHPGFVIIDSPLTPYKGTVDHVDDPELTAEVHPALLHSLATLDNEAQTIVIENIDPPDAIRSEAIVHEFVGAEEEGRSGFYP